MKSLTTQPQKMKLQKRVGSEDGLPRGQEIPAPAATLLQT